MTGGVFALAIAAIGIAYAGLVLRAAPTRRDNVVFAALAATDAVMTGWRGLNVLAGGSIVDSAVTLPCSLATVLLAVITIEFIASFPRGPAMAWRWRGGLWLWSAIAIVIIIAIDAKHEWGHSVAESVYFAPTTVIIFGLGARAWHRTREPAARTVIAVLWFRWAVGFSAYFFAPALGIFEQAVWAETTVSTLISFIVIGTAVLRSDLFSLRSVAAETLTIATLALVVVAGGGAAIVAIQRTTDPGSLRTVLLVGATLVPLALAGAGHALYPRVERRVLASLDERRGRRLGVLGEPLPADASEAIAEACRRIAAIGDGSAVRWQAAGALPPELAEQLRDGAPRRRDEEPALIACLIVPAIGAVRAVVGAFLIDDGKIDRDTYVVARDLASRIALIVERATAVSALEDARRLAALGQFAAAIAHDIRTPLTSISLNVQILRRKLELSDDDAEHLDIALEELRRLDRSVAEILDFSKPVRLVTEPIDVGALLEDAARGLSPVLSGKGVALLCEPGTERLPTVQGDARRLRQVLVNLVDNAADASAPGAEVTLRAGRGDASHIHIDVEDRGRGIGAGDLARIFEPFFTTRADGTGLGLAICQKVVSAHGGELRVRSIPGEGSTFTIVLPAA